MASELKFLKGMNKDTGLYDQIDGTYRDALNAVVDINKGAISNEYGNKLVKDLGYSPCGQIALPNDNFIIFGTKNVAAESAILLVNIVNNTSTTLLKTYSTNPFNRGHLNFTVDSPITGEYRVSPTGEIIIYFTDNKYKFTVEPITKIEYVSSYNPPRVFNVTRQQNYLASSPSDNQRLYVHNNFGHNINTLNLFMDAGQIPEFDAVKILQGGGVVSGAYYLAIAYADKDFTETNVLGMSNPVYITPSPDKYIPFEMVNGAPKGTQTNKSIKWDIKSINTDYKYLVPFILQRVGDTDYVYKLEYTEILGTTSSITYSGLEGVEKTTVEDAVVDKVKYLSAKSIAQLDNKLYAANLTARKDLGYQRFANGLEVEAVVKSVTKFDSRIYDIYNVNEGYSAITLAYTTTSNTPVDLQHIKNVVFPVQNTADRGYRDATRLFKDKTYRRGEVYAFYISFVLKDGSESYAYHIPGRRISAAYENQIMQPNVPAGTNFQPQELLSSDPNSKTYQYLDTSITTGLTTGYWENQNETYPNTPDFAIWSTDPLGTPIANGTLVGQNVRHHKMPSNHNSTFSTLVLNTDFSTPDLTTGNADPVKIEETVRILGFRLKNIRIPKFILEQIQGYKVYYAKRNQGNKTIIGQSGLHPGTWVPSGNLSASRSSATDGPFYHLWYMIGMPNYGGFYYENTEWSGSNDNLILQSVFKFHDFTLLRKQHTLATATHIDLQYVATMQQWRGRYKNIRTNNVPSQGDVYESFRHGDDEYAWIHPDLGNTVNLDYPSGDQDVWGPKNAYGFLMVAAKYSQIGTPGVDSGTSVQVNAGGLSTNIITAYGNQNILSNLQTIFSLDPDSATYLSGLSFLKNVSATGFKGATYIINNSGESSILLGLKSGIPPLFGYNSTYNSTTGLPTWASTDYQVLRKIIGSNGRPNIYIANLCASKTDVFEPFDEQKLVWTGHYKSLLTVSTVTGIDSANTKLNYYTGAVSDNIFGGDTYICKYSYRTTSQRFAYRDYIGGGQAPLGIDSSTQFNPGLNGSPNIYTLSSLASLDSASNFNGGYAESYDPYTTLYQIIVESDDNINLRHTGDTEKGIATVNSVYFDKYTAADVLWKSPLHDLTKADNLLYEDHYSALQDIRVSIPYPKKEKSTNLYPNRVIRSVVQDGNFSDSYRYFLPIDFKDFGQNRGAITNIFNLNSLIYIHTEKSLFRTKGKQNLELGDASEAFIGSGDLFAQEPDEFLQSSEGHLGLTNKMGAVVTKDGYIFVSRNSRKMFLVTDKLQELSDLGLTTWSRENIPFALENYGVSIENMGVSTDAPTDRFGFLVTFDPLFKRVIFTKRELVPTQLFITLFDSGQITIINGVLFYKGKAMNLADDNYFDRSGWTLSMSLETGTWASRHSYIPPLYAFNTKYLYSFTPNLSTVLSSSFYVHNDYNNPGNFYGSIYNFEVDFISTGDSTTTATGAVTSTKQNNKLYTAVSYVAETYKVNSNNITEIKHILNPGFSKFYIYNTTQISDYKDIKYLNNIRKVDQNWVFNDFRDISKIDFTTNLVNGQTTPMDDLYSGTYSPTESYSMFTSEGIINLNYIDSSKPWYEQRKFVDKFLGVRLISSNREQNLINLYSAKASYRISNR
jgi:hypothetical protein